MSPSMLHKIKELEPENLAILSYFSDERSTGTFSVGQFLKRYPFAKYLFEESELEEHFRELALRGLLQSEDQSGATVYSSDPRLKRAEVVEAGHVLLFMNACRQAVLDKIPLYGFAELAASPYDPCLETFKNASWPAGNARWWETLCALSSLFTTAASPGNPIAPLIHVLEQQMRIREPEVQRDSDEEEKNNRAWQGRGRVKVPFMVDRVTPWKSLHCLAFFLRAPDFDTEQMHAVSQEALAGLLEDAAIESLILPVGQMGRAAGEVFAGVKGVLIDGNDVKTIALAKSPKEEFREILKSRLDIRLLSPYEVHGSVPEEMFFGREGELRIILSHPNTNFAVYGGRQSGKTSLLKQLRRVFQDKRRVVYLDCETDVKDEADFWEAICFKLDIGDHADASPAQTLMKRIPWGTILLIDEIDPVLDLPCARDILARLRKLHEEQNIQCIVAGWTTLHRMSKDINSPMFNFADPLKLGPFTEKEAVSLAMEPMVDLGVGFEDGEGTVKQLVNLAGRFPNLVQVMCTGIVERLGKAQSHFVTRKLLEEVFATDVAAKVCDIFYHTLNDSQRLVVCSALLVKEMNLQRIVEKAQQHCPKLDLNEIRFQLQELTILFLLDPTETGGYKWVYEQFPAILRKNVEPEFLIEQMARAINPASSVAPAQTSAFL
jgi:hypothetical protein